MKTSKIIFTSLLAAVTIVILAGFIVVRMNGKKIGVDFVVNNKIIPSFNVLCINNSDIHLVYGDSSFFSMTTLKDSLLPEIEYKINNDTLTISNIRFSNRSNTSVEIHSTDSLKSIKVINSDLAIDKYGSKNLTLGLDKGNVSFNYKDQFTFQTLLINAINHSAVYSNDIKADTLNVFLQKSEANLEIVALKLGAILSDSSTFSTRQSAEISIKKDESSKLIIYE